MNAFFANIKLDAEVRITHDAEADAVTINDKAFPPSARLYAFLGSIHHRVWCIEDTYAEAVISGAQAKRHALKSGLAQAEPLISDYQNSRDYERPVWASPLECQMHYHPRTGRLYSAREIPDCITDYFTFCSKHAAWERCENYAALLKDEPEGKEHALRYWRKALKAANEN